MKYTIIEDKIGIRVEGKNEEGILCFEQPFNSFTSKPFASKEECQKYCTDLGYIDKPVETEETTTP